MDKQLLLVSSVVGLALLVVASAVIVAVRGQAAARARRRLEELMDLPEQQRDAAPVVLRDMEASSLPFLSRLLRSLPLGRRLELLLVQANVKMRAGAFLLLVLVAAAGAGLAASWLGRALFIVPVALVAGWLPVAWLLRRKQRRILDFERLFPDALDLLTGALRSGLALNAAIQVVADECPPPVGQEFMIVFEENRLGLDLKEALRNMGQRIESTELRLFIAAVILQRETGGNLSEILEGTAAVVRERFRILGDVRSLTAQQRFSGIVLAVLPIVMAIVMVFLAPDYLKVLLHDPAGPYLIGFAVVMQIVGYWAIRRIVAIKV